MTATDDEHTEHQKATHEKGDNTNEKEMDERETIVVQRVNQEKGFREWKARRT